MTGIILAAGSAGPFSGDFKPALVVDGERLLDRQVRQFRPHVDRLILATHKNRFRVPPEVELLNPAKRRWKCETLASTAEQWGSGDVLVLHGDVYFTDEASHRIVEYEWKACGFFWDTQEVFALRIPKERRLEALDAARSCVKETEEALVERRERMPRNGCGLASLLKMMQAMGIPTVTIEVADETQDFDTPEEYNGWQIGWRKNKLRTP